VAKISRLDIDEIRERLRLTEAEAAVLDKICSGEYVRNATAILGAIKLRLEHSYGRAREAPAPDGGEQRTPTRITLNIKPVEPIGFDDE
jgi:hypothetical protein